MRYRSIDLLRAYAITVMVMVHFLENLSGTRDWSPDGFGAPIFAFLTGVSYRLWLLGREKRGATTAQITRETIRRGLFLMGLGFVFNAFIWMPDDLFTWDVLTFLGGTMWLLNIARLMPTPAVLLTIVLSIILSPVMQRITDYSSYWSNGYFETEPTLSALLTGFLVTGYFPIFPWIALPLAGFLGAPALLCLPGTKSGMRQIWIITACALTGLVIFLLSLRWSMSWELRWLPAWTMFPASLSYMACVPGMVILMLGALHHCVDERMLIRVPDALMSRAVRFSRYSLTVYLLHHVTHLWPLWIYGMWKTGEPTIYWGQALSWWPSFLLSLLFLGCCDWVLKQLETYRVPTVENLMRWLCE
ncbi:MAG: heparan-alpha-glucosaminide N-acetyltransferase domain-containing protein [Planctomycetota bacterium]